jgi:mutator protein MutT
MIPSQFFHHCPRCGAKQAAPPTGLHFDCAACQFRFYFNPAVAIGVFIRREDGRLLFIRRAKDPGKGKLAPPGGFIDIGERAEEAVRREIREEVGIELDEIEFLASFPNEYHFREVTYPVLDFFFTAVAREGSQASALDDVASFAWLPPEEVPAQEIAFPSMRAAWESYRQKEHG